jgi:DNA-binding response OmpR family regulator
MRQPHYAPSLLVVSNDEAVATNVTLDFLQQGFSVAWERRHDRAIDRIAAERPSLVLFDAPPRSQSHWQPLRTAQRGGLVMMVDPKEAAAARRLRADVCVVRPEAPGLLVQHLGTLWNRLTTSEENRPAPPTQVQVGLLAMDDGLRELSWDGQPVRLTWSEFELLWSLASRPGELVTRDELIHRVTRTSYITGRIDVHICRVRRKLVAAGFDGRKLKSVRLVGYVLMLES